MNVIEAQKLFVRSGRGPLPPSAFAGGGYQTSEVGRRASDESHIRQMQRLMYVDPRVRAAILEIRNMDRGDGRVKKIHKRLARDTVRGGIMMTMPVENRRLQKLWKDFSTRLQLDNPQKLLSDARGLAMEGNLPMQWVLDNSGHVVACVRMPSETIHPVTDETGRLTDPAKAYEQIDLWSSKAVATFPLWQLSLVRLDPENFDDLGSMGRPYLDATRTVWRKLSMTEEDLVIRRRERAPLRTSHMLEGATEQELQDYQNKIETDQREITTNYYMNKKGAVTAVQGDANLDQIADVAYLLDTFFAGGPAPKGLFGYVGDIARDILEDLKRDYYEEVDSMQEVQAWLYRIGFELELLLQGQNPGAYQFDIQFAERRTETANQAADRALKYQALGASMATVFETAGLNPSAEKGRLGNETKDRKAYPDNGNDDDRPTGKQPRVSITPSNRRKGESGTEISNG